MSANDTDNTQRAQDAQDTEPADPTAHAGQEHRDPLGGEELRLARETHSPHGPVGETGLREGAAPAAYRDIDERSQPAREEGMGHTEGDRPDEPREHV